MTENDAPQAGPGATGATGPDSGPRVTRDDIRDVRRLRRPAARTVAGVSAGLARHFDVDPILFRIAFVVLTFFGGAGLLMYGALWLLMPEDGAEQAVLHLDERSRGIALAGVGALAVLLVLGDTWGGGFWFPWPWVLVGLAVWFLFFRDQGAERAAAPAPVPYGAPVAGMPQDPATHPATGPHPSYQWAPPPPPPPTRPRDPRRQGPLLFPFTVALMIFALGCLGVADVAGVQVTVSAYPALALGVTAVMLVVGAFWGRAGGLIALGLVAALVTGISTAAERSEGEEVTETPASAAAVEDEYWVGAGELVLDLTEVDDLDALDGRSVRVGAGVGRLEVVVPDSVDVEVRARLGGFGAVNLFGAERGGIGTEWTRTHDSGPDSTAGIDLDVELAIGEIVVRSE